MHTYPIYNIIDDELENPSPPPKYEIKIDFDKASKAWRRNKIYTEHRIHNTFDRYCCGVIKKNGLPCRGFPACWAAKYRPTDGSPYKVPGKCKRHLQE